MDTEQDEFVERELNDRQEMFCREYIIDFNGTQAAKRAGYSENSANEIASQNLAKLNIRNRVNELLTERSKRVNINADYVLGKLVETSERCSQAIPVLDRKGNQVVIETPQGQIAAAFTFDSRGVTKANELLGKHLKLFTDVKEIRGDVNNPQHHVVEVTRESIREMIKAIRDEF